jgi:hypothetical protein
LQTLRRPLVCGGSITVSATFANLESSLVSQHVGGSQGVGEYLLRFIGRPITGPLAGEPPPARGNIDWHRREVFRAPAGDAP